jgi:hypothetical protein
VAKLQEIAFEAGLIGYEDVDLRTPELQRFLHSLNPSDGKQNITALNSIVLIRHPVALFSSLRQKGFCTDATLQFYKDRWMLHARVGLSRRLFDGTPAVPVVFEEWVSNAVYRGGIACKLGLPTAPLIPSIVPHFGGGSSYTGQARIPRVEELRSRGAELTATEVGVTPEMTAIYQELVNQQESESELSQP